MDFTFHPAVVVCFPDITESGFVEYHLVNARGWSNFDSVLQFLNDEFDAKVIEKFDGIWTRDYELDVKGTLIFFQHHEDIGNLYFSQSKVRSPLLDKIAERIYEIVGDVPINKIG